MHQSCSYKRESHVAQDRNTNENLSDQAKQRRLLRKREKAERIKKRRTALRDDILFEIWLEKRKPETDTSRLEELKKDLRKLRLSKNGVRKKLLRQEQHLARVARTIALKNDEAPKRVDPPSVKSTRAQRREMRRQHRLMLRKKVDLSKVAARSMRQEQHNVKRVVKKVVEKAQRNNTDLVIVIIALVVDAQNGKLKKVGGYEDPSRNAKKSLKRKTKRLLAYAQRHSGNPVPGIIAFVWDAYCQNPFRIRTYQKLAVSHP